MSNETALDRLERLLEKQRKRTRVREPDHVAFDSPLWDDPFGPNWLALVIYDRGDFWVEQDALGQHLRYDLRSLHSLVFCVFAAMMFFLFAWAGGGISTGVKIGAAMFVWLYGGNQLISFFRVPHAIRQAVHRD